MLDVYVKRFEHPYLLALVPIAALLLGLSAFSELLGSHQIAGFLALYSVAALIICVIGYSGLISLELSTRVVRQWRYRRSGTDRRD